MTPVNIAHNLAVVQGRIAAACERSGRTPDTVTLVAVSKRKPAADVLAAAAAGVVHFGENRVEELSEKHAQVMSQVASRVVWHMIGHIQSRKTRHIPTLFDTVDAVDSMKLAEKLSAVVVAAERPPLPTLIEVNVSGEANKAGLAASGWQSDASVYAVVRHTVAQMTALPGLDVRGLMTMAPFVSDPELARPVFVALRELRDALVVDLDCPLPELSMGMTNDFEVAIEEGATLVRIGRAIFGERD